MVSGTRKDVLVAYCTGKSFPSVSVTGTRCDQMCEHCKGIHLKGMKSVANDRELSDLARSIVSNGGKGFLLSGGCDVGGTVPVIGFANALRQMPRELMINVHAGFVTPSEAKTLADADVAVFSVDVHQDPGVIRSVFHLDRGPEDYSDLLDVLIGTGVRVVPHITAGFGYNDLVQSVRLVKSKGLKDVVLLSLIPTKGTAVEDAPISEDAIIDSLEILQNEGLDVTLGCMRDRSLRGLERRCILKGVRRIANPSPATLRWAESEGLEVRIERMCCSIGSEQRLS